jgi:L1 cell adhesion molecule like protein
MKTALGDDLATVQSVVDETIKWLDESSERTKEEYEEKQKSVEEVLMPLIQKAYQANMPSGPEGSAPESSGPKVEEVD